MITFKNPIKLNTTQIDTKMSSREEKKQFYQNRARENRKLEKTRDLNVILKDVASEQPGYLFLTSYLSYPSEHNV